MNPVISLTTDFGHKGPFVALMKAAMLSRCPNASVIDYTHEIPVHWPPEAGFWLSRGFQTFPAGTVHVAVVDPGVGTERDIILLTHKGHWFLAPDNGLLGEILEFAKPQSVCRLDLERCLRRLQLPEPSNTFHGRDIFAPIAAELAAGRVTAAELGETVSDWVPSQIDSALKSSNRVHGTVITIDNFGNLISNIAAQDVPTGTIKVSLGGHEFPLRQTYGQVSPGDYLALINSLGVIEVAKSEGNASAGLGVERGAPVIVTGQT